MNYIIKNVIFKLSLVPSDDKEFFTELSGRLLAAPSYGMFNQLPHTAVELKSTLIALLEADHRAFIGAVPPSWLNRPDLLAEAERQAELLYTAVLQHCQH